METKELRNTILAWRGERVLLGTPTGYLFWADYYSVKRAEIDGHLALPRVPGRAERWYPGNRLHVPVVSDLSTYSVANTDPFIGFDPSKLERTIELRYRRAPELDPVDVLVAFDEPSGRWFFGGVAGEEQAFAESLLKLVGTARREIGYQPPWDR